MRIFVYYFDWDNTSGNHSGMAYFVRNYSLKSAHKVKLLRVPRNYSVCNSIFQRLWREYIILYLKLFAGKDDVIFFNEFLSQGQKTGHPVEISLALREKNIKSRIVGLIHLPESLLEKFYDNSYIIKALNSTDKIIVMGSSLENYIKRLIDAVNVITTFHYVDTSYYRPSEIIAAREFSVICTGNLLRDYKTLAKIIEGTPGIKFKLCLGKRNDSAGFINFSNVEIFGYLDESELLKQMQSSDIHLSVLFDTVGSNAITTSLACGLPQIVNRIGSIEDYCNQDNSILCSSVEDFVNAIRTLSSDSNKLNILKRGARESSLRYSLDKSIQWYDNFFDNNFA
ncbi:MAG: glycosyltransferase [Ignavibacteria bacterium]|nr:glycosyltransferase [Ignavibacteria bacterium]